jgi:excisionase family DNA binding protein
MEKNVLTMKEAAEYAGLSLSHLYKLTSAGKIPHSKPRGKKIYFSLPELERFLLSNPVKVMEQVQAEAATHVAINSGRKRKEQGR